MRVGLRADSSETIGAGHVVRQLSIAQFLARQCVDVFLIGDFNGPRWLRSLVREQNGINVVAVPEADFRPDTIGELSLDAVLVDSYQLSQLDLDNLIECVGKVGVMLDSAEQGLSGPTAFAPTFDRNAEWLAGVRGNFDQFYAGPEFFALREEVTRQRSSSFPHATAEKLVRVVISAGGGQSQEEELILRACLEILQPVHFDIFFQPDQPLIEKIKKSGHEVYVHVKGAGFLDLVASADVMISSAGSVAAELLYLRVPSIFVPIVANQRENAKSISQLGLGKVLWSTSPAFGTDLRAAVLATAAGESTGYSAKVRIDSYGSKRISEVMLSQP